MISIKGKKEMIREHEESKKLFEEAQQSLVGGVNSPVRAFKAVGGVPIFIAKGEGCRIFDVDGNEYIDYLCSWGPLILGHAHHEVIDVICKAAKTGTSFGAVTEKEIILANMIKEAFPSVELVRLVNSGTEAAMSAVRLARAFTKRDKIIKIIGCYHGHADCFLVKAGSGLTTFGIPDSAGVMRATADATICIPFNNVVALEEVFKKIGVQVAALIIEPIPGNIGVVKPYKDYLKRLREITKKYGVLLIFDEVITGFRVSYGGAQEIYDVKPDLTILGKIIGGGLPVGAYGGSEEIMKLLAPVGPVYQAGTLSGNPLAVSAGIKTLEILKRPKTYESLENISAKLEDGLHKIFNKASIPHQINRVGSMMTLFFNSMEVTDYNSALNSDTQKYSKIFHLLLERGIYLPPSQYECMFISLAHTEADIDLTLISIENALTML